MTPSARERRDPPVQRQEPRRPLHLAQGRQVRRSAQGLHRRETACCTSRATGWATSAPSSATRTITWCVEYRWGERDLGQPRGPRPRLRRDRPLRRARRQLRQRSSWPASRPRSSKAAPATSSSCPASGPMAARSTSPSTAETTKDRDGETVWQKGGERKTLPLRPHQLVRPRSRLGRRARLPRQAGRRKPRPGVDPPGRDLRRRPHHLARQRRPGQRRVRLRALVGQDSPANRAGRGLRPPLRAVPARQGTPCTWTIRGLA